MEFARKEKEAENSFATKEEKKNADQNSAMLNEDDLDKVAGGKFKRLTISNE